MNTRMRSISVIALVSAMVLFAVVAVAPVMAQASTPYVINGYVFYADGSECKGPVVSVTNLNTGNEWQAETNATTNYYELVLAKGTDVNASEILRFDAKDSAGTQFNTTDHTVTPDELNNGGVFSFNITLKVPVVNTYDFATNASEDRWAYRYQINNTNPPATNDVPDIKFKNLSNLKKNQYVKISTDNRKAQSDSTNQSGFYAAHRFVFNIADKIPAENIVKIGALWNGKGTHTDRKKAGATLYIWNGTAYEELNTTDSVKEVYLTGDVTAGMGNYIDATGNLTILVEQNHNQTVKGKRDLVSKISTDYVKVDITHT